MASGTSSSGSGSSKAKTNLKSSGTSLSKALKAIATPKVATYNIGLKNPKGISSAAASRAKAAGGSGSSGGGSSGGGSGWGSNRGGYTYRAPSYSSGGYTPRTGGVSASGGVAPPVAWKPEGLASNYLQTAADLFARDPNILLHDLTTQRYGDLGQEQVYGQLAPTVRNTNALFLAMQGQDGIQGTDAEWINWLGEFIDQQLTPGEYFNSAEAMRNILGAAEGSPLRAYTTTGDGVEQTQNVGKLIDAVLDTGYHPLMADAIQASLDNDRRNYLAATAKAAQDPFVTYLQAQNPNLTRLLGV